MKIIAVTFYDEDGTKHVGELVNGSTVLACDGKSVHLQIDRDRTDEIVVVTYGEDDSMLFHSVLMGNVASVRPMAFS